MQFNATSVMQYHKTYKMYVQVTEIGPSSDYTETIRKNILHKCSSILHYVLTSN